MDFVLSEEQQAIFDMAHDFADQMIAPHAVDWDQSEQMPKDVLREAAELGLAAIYVPEEHGGSGLSRLDATLIFEALAMACPSVSSFLSIHNMVAWMVSSFGDEKLRQRYLADLCSMQKIGSYCLTEPGSGSDAAALKTKAERTNEGWQVTGTKSFISGGNYSDLYIVMCRTGEDSPKGISALIVDSEAQGLSFGAPEKKMGWRGQPTAQVIMDKCEVPSTNLLGGEGQGFTYAMKGLDGGRLNIAAAALGGAQSAYNKALAYSKDRTAFGKSIDQFQSLQFKLADMHTHLEAARVFLRQAAWKLDNGTPDASRACAMAKQFVTDTCFDVANQALQIHGGYGYLADYGLEKIVRDLRVHQILEGTNEIMRVIISRSVLAERDR
ncbi:MAG: acyl-CoA dehydrogenase [SAR116 cluster bacterium]|nr:acyl-CoA dehydrogenase [SAR116 cluster bacterium]HCD63254.1 acyl-CoA dehydrogenase [Alphaproteobacteria bacterium]|tara:strand:+ start:270 stop:1418 length:1149 start_codon:yes stop_codon:yes gene_type:complete